ncbi:hypothetical protein ACHM2L_15235 [Clostridium perfringens]|uniref:hypothetical protein n=1 Tax=Clostridium perfringens TaxID=1502 RepID=UPI0029727A9A|nr:hypothetical protein [Clostridium perfringens]MDK0934428.1 hypothetical protein [Clostridium perfringens]MDM0987629.1 hypothetical protein [Clostridium perfringens]
MLNEIDKKKNKISFEKRLEITANIGNEAVKITRDFKHKCNFSPMNDILTPEELKELERALGVLKDINNKIHEALEFGI